MLFPVVIPHFRPVTFPGLLAADAVCGMQRAAKNSSNKEKRHVLIVCLHFMIFTPFSCFVQGVYAAGGGTTFLLK